MTLYAQNQENSLSQINVKTKLLIQKQASFPVSDPSVGKFVLSELYCNIKNLVLKPPAPQEEKALTIQWQLSFKGE